MCIFLPIRRVLIELCQKKDTLIINCISEVLRDFLHVTHALLFRNVYSEIPKKVLVKKK